MNNYFEGYKKLEETDNFAILINPEADPSKGDPSSNYVLIYKPTQRIEISINSYPQVLWYLVEAEQMYQKSLDLVEAVKRKDYKKLEENKKPTSH